MQKVTRRDHAAHGAAPSHKETGLTNLCLAGGVALNCVANGRILRETPLRATSASSRPPATPAARWARPLYVCNTVLGKPPHVRAWTHAYLGPEFSDDEIADATSTRPARSTASASTEDDLLADAWPSSSPTSNVVGWFQGRMEFGPRALGHRSILADAARPEDEGHPQHEDQVPRGLPARSRPACSTERASECFELDCDSPYMLLVAQVRDGQARSSRRSPTSTARARLQTVTRETNPLYYDLIHEFGELTGVPVIINTIVQRARRAHRLHPRTTRTGASCGPTWTTWCSATYLLDKKEQEKLRGDVDWRSLYELD